MLLKVEVQQGYIVETGPVYVAITEERLDGWFQSEM